MSKGLTVRMGGNQWFLYYYITRPKVFKYPLDESKRESDYPSWITVKSSADGRQAVGRGNKRAIFKGGVLLIRAWPRPGLTASAASQCHRASIIARPPAAGT